MPGACTWFSRTRGSGGSTPKGIVLADRRFEYRQGCRRLGTVQEQPLWQRKPDSEKRGRLGSRAGARAAS